MLTPRQVEWIAGFLEGEGHFCFQRNSARRGGCPVITADQVQRFPLDKIQLYLGGRVYWRPERKASNGIHVWYIRGKLAASVMMTVYSLMSPRRKGQIADSLEPWRKLATYNGNKTHCKRGHEFTPENTIRFEQNGKRGRRCRTCDTVAHSKGARAERKRLRLLKPSQSA